VGGPGDIFGGRGQGFELRVWRGEKSGGNEGECGFHFHDIVGEARGAIEFVMWNICVFFGKVRVRWDVTCGLSSETKEGVLVKEGAQVFVCCSVTFFLAWRGLCSVKKTTCQNV